MSERWIVTTATDSFHPGARALYHSVRKWCPGVKFAVMFYTPHPARWPAERVQKYVGAEATVLINYPVPVTSDLGKTYSSNGLTVGPEMYARMMIPREFSGRVFYVDADCLILRSINDLWTMDLHGHPSACVDRGDIGWRNDKVDMASGTILIDCAEWVRVGMTERCLDLQATETPDSNVEGLISRAHGKKYLHLGAEWQNLAYFGSLCRKDRVLHLAGFKPWLTDPKGWWVNYAAIWRAYYEDDAERIEFFTRLLPENRPEAGFSNMNNRLALDWRRSEC